MSIQSYEELLALKEVGSICRLALGKMAERLRPGIPTAEWAEVGAKVMRENGARSAPAMVYGFPGEICISLNDEAVHGIPSERPIRTGDLVKLDVTCEKGGYMADAAITVPVEPVRDEARRLVSCAARARNRVREIGRAVEREARRSGFSVIRELGGLGIGRTIHESPSGPNYNDRKARQQLTPGPVITVEPIIALGEGALVTAADGWTERTVDESLSAHFEHTIVVTERAPILLTAA